MPPRPSFKSDAVLWESSQAAVFDAARGAPGVLSELRGLGSRRAHAHLQPKAKAPPIITNDEAAHAAKEATAKEATAKEATAKEALLSIPLFSSQDVM